MVIDASIRKITLACIIANSLHMYNFVLCGVLANALVLSFFPPIEQKKGLLIFFIFFALGFFMRPVGSIIFGFIGDKFGRKNALVISLIMMAITSFAVSVLPTYENIGIVSTIMFGFYRVLQGLCVEGGLGGVITLGLEYGNRRGNGFIGGLIIMSSILGGFGAIVVGLFFDIFNQGWRLAFLFGTSLLIVAIYISKKIDESPKFKEFLLKNEIVKFPIKYLFLNYLKVIASGINVSLFASVISYTMVIYMIHYLEIVSGKNGSIALLLSCIGVLWFALSCPVSGYFSDRYGQTLIMKIFSILILIFSFPLFFFIKSGIIYYIVAAQVLLNIFVGGFVGCQVTFLNNLFPLKVRYTGVAFCYSMGAILGGGILPLINTFFILKMKILMTPAFYLMVSAFVAFLSLMFVNKEDMKV